MPKGAQTVSGTMVSPWRAASTTLSLQVLQPSIATVGIAILYCRGIALNTVIAYICAGFNIGGYLGIIRRTLAEGDQRW